jgi:hypothetical protein
MHGIGIYGVGEPVSEELSRDLRSTFADVPEISSVRELPWNDAGFVTKPLLSHSWNGSALHELATALARASLIGSECGSGPVTNLLAGRIVRLSRLIFVACEVSIALIVAVVLVFLPVFSFWGITAGYPGFLPLVPTAIWLTVLRYLGIFVIALSIALLFSAVVLWRVSKTIAPLWVSVRRLILVLLRPLLLAVPLVFKFVIDTRPKNTTFLAFILNTVGFATVMTLAAMNWHGLGNLIKEQFAAPVLILLWASSIAWSVAYQIVRLVGTPSSWFVKVLLDIFRYVANPEYRRSLQALMDAALRELPVAPDCIGRSVILFAHSLGSVIAMDSLINSPSWNRSDDVTLITFGSPLKTAFFRFFPGVMFPESAQLAARVIAARLRGFRWLNCYRKLDYVGKELDLGSEPWLKELRMIKPRGLLGAHLGYWTDPEFKNDVVEFIRAAEFSRAAEIGERYADTERSISGSHRRTFDHALSRLLLLFMIICPVFGVITRAVRLQHERGRRESLVRETVKHGHDAIADVVYWTTQRPIGTQGGTITLDKFRFSYSDVAGYRYSWTSEPPTIFGSFDENLPRFEYREFAKLGTSRSQCPVIFPTEAQPCPSPPVVVRYNKDAPSFFVVREFPPLDSGLESFASWWTYLIFMFSIVVFAGVVALGTRALFRLLIGELAVSVRVYGAPGQASASAFPQTRP